MGNIVSFPENGYPFSGGEVGASLAGLIVRDVYGVPRQGILPSKAALLSGRADWQVDVQPFVGVAVEGRVIRLGGIDEIGQVELDPPPVSGSRIDRVCWSPDQATPTLHVVPGAPNSFPVPPSTPTGMLSLGTAEVHAGDASTNQAEFVADFEFSATAGGTITVRTPAELAEWDAIDGSTAYALSNGSGYQRTAGAWDSTSVVIGPIDYVPVVEGYTDGWAPVTRGSYTRMGRTVNVEIRGETDREMQRINGSIFVTAPLPIPGSSLSVDGGGFFIAGPSAGRRILDLKVRHGGGQKVVLEVLRVDARAAERVPLQQAGLGATDLVSWRAQFSYVTS